MEHSNLPEWIGPMLQRKNLWTGVWKLLAFGGLLALGASTGWLAARGEMGVWTVVLQLGLGLLGALLLVPAHEVLHALAYRSVGALNVGFGADWKRLVFHCTAHGFVADLRTFRIVALTPFMVITAAGVGAAFVVPADWVLLPLAVVVAHATVCVGDFALLGYLREHRDQDMLTVDDVEAGTSAFLVLEEEAC